MRPLHRLALAGLLAALPAAAQFKTPVPIVPPTPTPGGFQALDPSRLGPKELPPTRTPVPARTPSPTPAPPDVRLVGPTWGPAGSEVPILVNRLDSRSQCKTKSAFQNSGRFLVMIDCYAQGYGPLGLKADATIGNGIRLKNGWKVKSFEITTYDGTVPPAPDAQHGFKVTREPVVGSDDPSVSLHLFSDWGKGIQVIGSVKIEGPHGTSPW